jgi:hypothetical protein
VFERYIDISFHNPSRTFYECFNLNRADTTVETVPMERRQFYIINKSIMTILSNEGTACTLIETTPTPNTSSNSYKCLWNNENISVLPFHDNTLE